jgi:hypothetical protein
MGPRIRIGIKTLQYGTLAKAPEKTVWKDKRERQKGKKKMKTRWKEKRRTMGRHRG